MQRYFDVVQTPTGDAIAGGLVSVFISGTTTLATLYVDNGITTAPNPLTTNSDGEYAFYAANGTYTLQITATNYATETKPGVVLFDPEDILPVSQGGTGASNATAARTNLSVAASGANADITSLTGLTTPLSVSQGGTGGSSVSTAATNLQGTGTDTNSLGFRTVPQNLQSTNYTTVASDSGKHVFTATGAITLTIASNASVPYPIGTAITFVNTNASSVTIAINSDTLTLAGSTTTGSRTLAQNGIATALKIDATSWLISGAGLT